MYIPARRNRPMYRTPQPPPPPFPPPDLVYHTQFTEQRPPGPPPVELLPGASKKGYDAAYKAVWTPGRAASVRLVGRG